MSTLIHRQQETVLVAGLEWRPLFQPAGRARDAEMREVARENGGHAVAVVLAAGRAFCGLYSPLDDEGERPPRGTVAHSAAAILARMAGEQQVVLALHLPQLRRVAVIAVEQGAPSIDVLQVPEKARETVAAIRAGGHGFEGHRLLTNDGDAFPGGELLSVDALVQAASTHTRLQRPPLNRRAWACGIALVALASAALAGGKLAWDERERQLRLRAAEAADPMPRYRGALAAQIGRLGIPPAAIAAWAARLAGLPVWLAGWELKALACRLDDCRSEWERRGGTTEALAALRPGEVLDASQSTADKAVLRWRDPALRPAGLPGLAAARMRAAAEAQNLAVWQTWANAGVRLQQSGPYASWPPAPGAVAPEQALKMRTVEARLPFVLLADVLATTPPDVWWSELRLQVELGAREQALQVTLRGGSYVR